MYKNDITPPLRARGYSQSLTFGGSKKDTMIEDDNTFVPPALSAYSIALLSDKTSSKLMTTDTKSTSSTTPPNVTGIYELDFPHNNFGNNLKSKLSVHFGESSSTARERVSSLHSISQGSLMEMQNQSQHNSFSTSNHTNTHTRDTISDDNDDAMDASLEGSAKSAHTSATTPGSTGGPSSAGSLSTGKRLRLSRRFRSLGPPQRASRVSRQESQEPEVAVNNRETDKATSTPPPLAFSPRIKRLRADPSPPDSAFLKTLAKLRSETLDENLLVHNGSSEMQASRSEPRHAGGIESQLFNPRAPLPVTPSEIKSLNGGKPERLPLNVLEKVNDMDMGAHRNQFQVFSDRNSVALHGGEKSSVHSTERISSSEHANRERVPLSSIPASAFNSVKDTDSFRKPKITKVISQRPSPSPLPPQIVNEHKEIQIPSAPLPAPQRDSHAAVPPSSSEDNKRKKVISINGNQYEKLELLGRGGTSKVYKVKALNNNRLYAIKKVVFDQFDDLCIKGFKGEIDLLLRLKEADRVVKLVDHAIGESSVYLVMECGDIDLAHVLQHKLTLNSPLDVNFVKFHAIEIFKCVLAVHQAGIVHSDLKPANFLFVRGILKIIDFGIANAVPDHTANVYRESQIGTPNYMAPEALIEVNQSFPGLPGVDTKSNNHQATTWKVGRPSDVWSCGCIMYQMIYGRPPYGAYSGNQRVMAIMDPQVKIQYSSKGIGGARVPHSAIELMQKCLLRNPNERWTVEQCLNSDFLNPNIVSESFVRDLVHLAVNYGYNSKVNGSGLITAELYDQLVDKVLQQIKDLNYG